MKCNLQIHSDFFLNVNQKVATDVELTSVQFINIKLFFNNIFLFRYNIPDNCFFTPD